MGTVTYLSNILGSIKVGRDSDNVIDFTTNDQITFATNNTTRVVISNSGFNLGGSNATVSTILDEDNMASDNAAALATQQSIKAYVDANAGSGGIAFDGSTANGVLTYKDSDEATVESNLTYDGTDLTAASSSDGKPVLTLKTTHTTKTSSAELQFLKDAADTEDGENLGIITFYGEDEGNNNTKFGHIKGAIEESDSGAEGGSIKLAVATHDGEIKNGLVINDGNAEDEVDVTIANGTASNTTIAGDLTVTSDIILDDGGSLQEAGGTAAFTFDGDGHVTKIGQDSPANGECLTWATGLSPNRAVWGTHYGPYALTWVDDSNDVLLRTTGSTNGSSATADLKMVAGAGVSLTPSGANMTIAVRDASGSDKGIVKVAASAASVTPEAITTTADRSYAVQVDGDGVASVNVPWVDTTADSTKLPLAGGTITGTTTFNSDIALRFGHASTFIEGATSGSKLMLNGQTDMFMRINGTTILQIDPNKAELAKPLDITDTTDSTDATGDTGALRCEGGGSIAKKLYVGTDLSVGGAAAVVGGALSISGDGSNAVTLTESGSGDFTIDAADDIRLDAGGADVVYKDGGTEFGRLSNSSTDFVIKTSVADKDLILMADGGSGDIDHAYITLDGSRTEIAIGANTVFGVNDAGKDVTFYGDTNAKKMTWDTSSDALVFEDDTYLKFGTGNDGIIFVNGDNLHIEALTSDKDIIFKGNDGGAVITALTLDMSNGGAATFNNDVIAYSDRKLKENIETLDGKKVLEMRGVSFDRIDTGKASSGVIAQELQEVAPELVSETDGTLGVSYGNLVGYLIEAVKDQQKQINELKEIINGGS